MDEINLGKKIRKLRVQRGLSQLDLAQRANITPSMLSQIENDQVGLSLKTVRAIASVLNVPIYQLFKEDVQQDIIVRKSSRPIIGQKGSGEVFYELLTPDGDGELTFTLMTLPPHQYSAQEGRVHNGEEVLYVLSGSNIQLEIEGETFELCAGDSARIAPLSFHRYYNASEQKAEIIFAIRVVHGT